MAKLEKILPYYAMKTTVAGIPCLALPTVFHAGEPQTYWHPGCPPECEFELYDRKGYRAHWLDKKMTEADVRRIENECLRHDFSTGED